MGKHSEVFVAFDVAKKKHAVAVAEGGRAGEVRFLGDVENNPLPIERTIKRLAARYDRLHVCFEAGPTGYGLYRQVQALGHDCMVVAPALIPKRAGERIKTNRRDAVALARLYRAGELTGVWAPNPAHEAVRDLVRAREAAADDLRRKRQQLLSFILRHSRIYSGRGHWTLAHRRWLAGQKFDHAAQQIVFQEGVDAIEDSLQRIRRVEKQLALVAPEWSMAPVEEAKTTCFENRPQSTAFTTNVYGRPLNASTWRAKSWSASLRNHAAAVSQVIKAIASDIDPAD